MSRSGRLISEESSPVYIGHEGSWDLNKGTETMFKANI
jgi:hypothetical protein